jgi:hypothetical protein
MYENGQGSESVELLELVAIGGHQDTNPSMGFIQLEALYLTPPGGIVDLCCSVCPIVLRMTSILSNLFASCLGQVDLFFAFYRVGFCHIWVFLE